MFPLIPCGKCKCCQDKRYEMCSNYNYLGSRCNGGLAEYVAVPEWNLLELTENISYRQAAMLEPMAVAVHAMRQFTIKKEPMYVLLEQELLACCLLCFLKHQEFVMYMYMAIRNRRKDMRQRLV